jgi:hypothetical protein
MPPARTTSDNASRRTKPFKAPTRVDSESSAPAKSIPKTREATTKTTTRSKPTASKKKATSASIVISDGEDESEDDFGSDVEITAGPSKRRSTTSRNNEPSTPRRHSTTALAAAEDNPIALLEEDMDEVTIPRPLLARLLYQGFEDKNMRIGKEPMGIMELYTKVFVKEALARSKQEAIDKEGVTGGSDTSWLQVEDLEKIAPQLMLDF